METQSGEKAIAKAHEKESSSFESLGLVRRLSQEYRASSGKQFPTEIQLKTVPAILSGDCDLLIKADRFSGRTFAYMAPIIHLMLDIPQSELNDGPYALVLVPEDGYGLELYDIVFKQLKSCKYDFIIPEHLKSGGDKDFLARGISILIAKPAVVLSCLKEAAAKFSNLRWIVFVDAERYAEVYGKEIQDLLPKLNTSLVKTKRQHVFICSAFNDMVNTFVKMNFNNLLLIGFDASERLKFDTLKGVDVESVEKQLIDYRALKASGKRLSDLPITPPPSKALRISDAEIFTAATIHTRGNIARDDKSVADAINEGMKLMTSRVYNSLKDLEAQNKEYDSLLRMKEAKIKETLAQNKLMELQLDKSLKESENLKLEIATMQAELERERKEKQEVQALFVNERLMREKLLEQMDNEVTLYQESALFKVQLKHGPLNLMEIPFEDLKSAPKGFNVFNPTAEVLDQERNRKE